MMNRDEVFNLYKQLDKAMDCALAADKDEDDTEVVISYRLASAIGLILDRMVYPEAAGNTEPAAATQPTTRDEVRLIEAVRNTVKLFSREEMLEAYRCVGRIDSLVDRDGTTAQEKAFDTVCRTLDQLNRSMTTIIDALKEFDDAR